MAGTLTETDGGRSRGGSVHVRPGLGALLLRGAGGSRSTGPEAIPRPAERRPAARSRARDHREQRGRARSWASPATATTHVSPAARGPTLDSTVSPRHREARASGSNEIFRRPPRAGAARRAFSDKAAAVTTGADKRSAHPTNPPTPPPPAPPPQNRACACSPRTPRRSPRPASPPPPRSPRRRDSSSHTVVPTIFPGVRHQKLRAEFEHRHGAWAPGGAAACASISVAQRAEHERRRARRRAAVYIHQKRGWRSRHGTHRVAAKHVQEHRARSPIILADDSFAPYRRRVVSSPVRIPSATGSADLRAPTGHLGRSTEHFRRFVRERGNPRAIRCAPDLSVILVRPLAVRASLGERIISLPSLRPRVTPPQHALPRRRVPNGIDDDDEEVSRGWGHRSIRGATRCR